MIDGKPLHPPLYVLISLHYKLAILTSSSWYSASSAWQYLVSKLLILWETLYSLHPTQHPHYTFWEGLTLSSFPNGPRSLLRRQNLGGLRSTAEVSTHDCLSPRQYLMCSSQDISYLRRRTGGSSSVIIWMTLLVMFHPLVSVICSLTATTRYDLIGLSPTRFLAIPTFVCTLTPYNTRQRIILAQSWLLLQSW